MVLCLKKFDEQDRQAAGHPLWVPWQGTLYALSLIASCQCGVVSPHVPCRVGRLCDFAGGPRRRQTHVFGSKQGLLTGMHDKLNAHRGGPAAPAPPSSATLHQPCILPCIALLKRPCIFASSWAK